MPCDLSQSPRIAPALGQAGQERVAERVEHEWPDRLPVVHCSLFRDGVERGGMCLPDA